MRPSPCSACGEKRLLPTQIAGTWRCRGCSGEEQGALRVICSVPFCTGACGDRKGQPPLQRGHTYRWICGKHWRLVPGRLKAALRTTERRMGRILRARPEHREWWLYSGRAQRLRALAMWHRYEQAWDACVRAAQDRAGGLL